MSQDHSNLDIESFFTTLHDAFAGLITWTWDERYNTVVGEFKRQEADRIIDILEHHFTAMWDGAVIGSASALEQEVNRQLGGIEPGQALYSTDPQRGEIVFCAWWRWSDGRHYSLRIGASTLLPAQAADPQTVARMRDIFGVKQ